jgi:hypothetical protein
VRLGAGSTSWAEESGTICVEPVGLASIGGMCAPDRGPVLGDTTVCVTTASALRA